MSCSCKVWRKILKGCGIEPGEVPVKEYIANMAEEATVHIEAWYTGRVQGVGFRYQTTRVAREYEVSGWVQNLADGRVHLVAEGRREEVEGFLEGIRHEMEAYIRDVEVREGDSAEGLRGFTIRG